jgi:plasmid stabilization system protein ParE
MPEAYRVTLTPSALADLDRLDTFLREKNSAAADRMLAAFDMAFTRLSENPFDCPAISGMGLRARVVRFGKGGYACLYRVSGQAVIVARLFHAREDWQSRQEQDAPVREGGDPAAGVHQCAEDGRVKNRCLVSPSLWGFGFHRAYVG